MDLGEEQLGLTPSALTKPVKMQITTVDENNKDCVTSEVRKGDNGEYKVYTLYCFYNNEKVTLPFIFRRSLNALSLQWGRKSETWVGNWVEVFYIKSGDFYNWTLKPVPISTEQYIEVKA